MKKYALIGKKLSYSYSKTIHEYLMDLEIFASGSYELLEMDEFRMPEGIEGLNITNPYKDLSKTSAAKHMHFAESMFITDAISQCFKKIPDFSADRCYKEIVSKTVNTLKIRDASVCANEIIADKASTDTAHENKAIANNSAAHNKKCIESANTDIFGFCLSFCEFIQNSDECAILGTGATSAMIQTLMRHLGKSIKVFGRNSADKLRDYCKDISSGPRRMLVNCTPVGTDGNECKIFEGIDKINIEAFDCVADLVYNPELTPLAEIAASAGISVKTGLEMLVLQAVAAQAIWNDCKFLQDRHTISDPCNSTTKSISEIVAGAIRHIKHTTAGGKYKCQDK